MNINSAEIRDINVALELQNKKKGTLVHREIWKLEFR